jgi:hypothetical protein
MEQPRGHTQKRGNQVPGNGPRLLPKGSRTKMHKYKQAIPFADQTPGYETDVVGRVLMVAHEVGFEPVTAWLQWESNAERTVVAVPIRIKFRAAIDLVSQVPNIINTRIDDVRKSFKLRKYVGKDGYVIMVHQNLATKQVTLMFANK